MYEELIEPTKIYLGKGKSKIPQNNSNDVLLDYGENVLNSILKLKDFFFNCDGCVYNKDNFDWDSTYYNVKNEFLKKYQDCSTELIDLFWWSYSFYLWKNGYEDSAKSKLK